MPSGLCPLSAMRRSHVRPATPAPPVYALQTRTPTELSSPECLFSRGNTRSFFFLATADQHREDGTRLNMCIKAFHHASSAAINSDHSLQSNSGYAAVSLVLMLRDFSPQPDKVMWGFLHLQSLRSDVKSTPFTSKRVRFL